MTGPAHGGAGGGSTTPGDELDERLRRRVLWSMPSGLYVVGSRAGESPPVAGDGPPVAAARWNLMTANLAIQVATAPALVAVAIDVEALTNRLVREGHCFALSLLLREDRAVVRRFVKPVPADEVVDEDGTVVSMAGEAVAVHVTGAPVLARAAAWLDCELRQVVPLGSHDLCVGEVVGAGGRGTDTEPAAILRMEDTRMHYGG